MRKLDPASFAQLLVSARNNGGLPRMVTLMLQVLDENGYERGAEIVQDYIFFTKPFDAPPDRDSWLEEVMEGAERANLETGGYVP